MISNLRAWVETAADRSSQAWALVPGAVLVALVCLLFAPGRAVAAGPCVPGTEGVPAISIAKSSPSKVLFGENLEVTLTASEPAVETYSGYNLTFRDVLPPNTAYVPGSSPVAPTIIADEPAMGYTTLLFENVADLAPGNEHSLTYRVSYVTSGPGAWSVGDTISTGDVATGAAGAYVNCNPREIAQFTAAGIAIPGAASSYSSSATGATASSQLAAIEVEKSEPSPEHELLRGVHDHQTVYTIELRNNLVNATDDVYVEDYLPAGLEFLGCGAGDNTTDSPTNPGSTEEYPGAGAIDAPGNAPAFSEPCLVPTIVDTVMTDPDGVGPLTTGVYTYVRFDLGASEDFIAGGTFRFQYAAAAPICPNTMGWSGAIPSTTGPQGSNLDNNNCALVGETVDETALTNFAIATGVYQDPILGPQSESDEHALTVTAEDLAVWKEVDSSTLAVGAITAWTLHVSTSEYRTYSGTMLNDMLPDGYCFVDSTTNHEQTPPPADSECDGTGNGADDPTVDGVPTAPTTAAEASDGSWLLSWTLGALDSNEEFDVVFKSRTRNDYQEGFSPDTPVLSGDQTENGTAILGAGAPVCSLPVVGVVACPGGSEIYHVEPTGTPHVDDSAAGQIAPLPGLDKQVRLPGGAVPVDCSTGSYVNGTASLYRSGDAVCWKLRVDFPANVSTTGIELTDFLPVGTTYSSPQPAGTGPTINDDFPTQTITDNTSYLTIALGVPTVTTGALTFERIIATTIDDPSALTMPTIRGNLLKMTTANTPGDVETYRAQSDLEYGQPELSITKGLRDINDLPAAGNAADTDGGTVRGNDVVTYRIDIANTGTIDSVNTEIREILVGPYDCTMISAISDGGSCATVGAGVTAVTTITWDAADAIGVAAAGTKMLTFDFTAPDSIAPLARIPDDACIDSFQNETNLGGYVTWYPDNPVLPCGGPAGTANAVAAHDDSYVTGGGSVAKTRTTSVTETNNAANTQATIGETIFYTVSYTVPAHTTVYNGLLRDSVALPAGVQTYVPGSVDCSLNGSPDACGTGVLTGFTAAFAAAEASLGFPATYTNTSAADQVFNLTFQVQVTDVPAAVHNLNVTNQGRLSQDTQYGVAASTVNTNTTSTRVVEPAPALAKSDNDADDIVDPNQEVEYKLTVTNPAAGTPLHPPLHDATVVDTLPAGVTPTDGLGTPIADGGLVALCDGTAGTGVWSAGPRTISWALGSVAPNSTTDLRYCVAVDNNPAGSATLTNNASLTGTSMPGAVTGERTYTRNASDTLTVRGATIAKSVSQATATIGDVLTYTIDVTLPANVHFYDVNVEDVMPAGISLYGFGSYSCTSGCPPTPAAPATSQAGQTLTWSFGDISAHTAQRELRLTYTAFATDVPANTAGQTLNNSATTSWRTSPGGTVVVTPPSQATVTLQEPSLAIDKDVSGQTADSDARDTQPGDSYTYTIAVTNNGDATAYDVVVNDIPAPGLANVVLGSGAAYEQNGWSASGDQFEWQIPSIAAGATVTLTYTADLVASAALSEGQTLVNTAHVPEYWSKPEAVRSGDPIPDYRQYTADPSDTVTITVRLPQLAIAKTTGAGAESGDAEIDQSFSWRVTVSNTSAYATAYDVDFGDTLPSGWSYDAGSASFTPGGSIEPSIAGQVLSWSDVGDIAPGGSIVLDFTATPGMSALVAGEPVNPYVNSASVTGEDATGATGSSGGPYGAGPDTAQATILMPTLSIAKTPDGGTATAGTGSSFTITIENSGLGTARGVVVTDLLPTGLQYTPGDATAVGGSGFTEMSVTANTPTPATTEIVWQFTSIAAGATATITLPVDVPEDATAATVFTNTASVHSNERPSNVLDTGDLTVAAEADMAIVKSDGGATGTAGQNVSYTLTATNNGPSVAHGVTISDTIDTAQFEFVSITPVNPLDSCGYVAPIVTCTVTGPLSSLLSPSRAFTLVLKINSDVTSTVSNTATVTANETDNVPVNNSSTDTTPIGTSADLTVVKNVSTGSPASIPNHDQTEFTISVENKGPSDALNVDLTDVLPAGLSCVSTTESGLASVTGCNGAAGETVVWSFASIAAGATEVVTIVVRGEAVGSQVNPASATSTTPLVNLVDDTDSATVTVTPMADLAVLKSAPAIAVSGSDIQYDVTVTNNGPDTAVNAVMTDTLPAGVSIVSIATDTGSCSSTASVVTCNLGDMNLGAVANIDIIVNVGWNNSDATIVNAAHVDTDTTDTITSNDDATATTVVGPNADVSIVKSGPDWGAADHDMTYTLAVQNAGPATAQSVTVNDALPSGAAYVSATPSIGSCSEAAGMVTCNLGDMTAGAAAQIQLVVHLDASTANTTMHNEADVSSVTPDRDPTNNHDEIDTTIHNSGYPTSSDVSITKTASTTTPAVGDRLDFTLAIANAGPSTATGVVVTDALPAGLLFVSADNAGCVASGQVVTCTLGDLAAGASVNVTIATLVMKSGDIANTATVTANNDREVGNNGATSPVVAQQSTARLTISKKASRKAAKPGQRVTYRIVVKNVSTVTAVNVRVCDLVPKGLSVVKRGGGEFSGGNLCWTLDYLDPGKSRTFKVVMRVNNVRSAYVSNPVRATAGNAATRRAKARIRVLKGDVRAGGVTG